MYLARQQPDERTEMHRDTSIAMQLKISPRRPPRKNSPASVEGGYGLMNLGANGGSVLLKEMQAVTM